jgi:hypothetical protein
VLVRRDSHVRNWHLGQDYFGRRRHRLSLARGRSGTGFARRRNRLWRRRRLERCYLATKFFGCRWLVFFLVITTDSGLIIHVNHRRGFVHLVFRGDEHRLSLWHTNALQDERGGSWL